MARRGVPDAPRVLVRRQASSHRFCIDHRALQICKTPCAIGYECLSPQSLCFGSEHRKDADIKQQERFLLLLKAAATYMTGATLMASQEPDVWQELNDSPALKAIKREKNRVSLVLLLIAAVYYMTLLLGASFFKALFVFPLAGELNLGTVFAISQYPFGGLLAWIYVVKMRSIDLKVEAIVRQYQLQYQQEVR
jgi:uncharacterized membrane protein (DUF485 family)